MKSEEELNKAFKTLLGKDPDSVFDFFKAVAKGTKKKDNPDYVPVYGNGGKITGYRKRSTSDVKKPGHAEHVKKNTIKHAIGSAVKFKNKVGEYVHGTLHKYGTDHGERGQLVHVKTKLGNIYERYLHNVEAHKEEPVKPEVKKVPFRDPGRPGGMTGKKVVVTTRGKELGKVTGDKPEAVKTTVEPPKEEDKPTTHRIPKFEFENPNYPVVLDEEGLSKILEGIGTDQKFKQWVAQRFDEPDYLDINFSPSALIAGMCDSVAVYIKLHYPLDRNLRIRDDEHGEHTFLAFDGKYYDGYDTDGVNSVDDLHFFRKDGIKGVKNIASAHDIANESLGKSIEIPRSNEKAESVVGGDLLDYAERVKGFTFGGDWTTQTMSPQIAKWAKAIPDNVASVLREKPIAHLDAESHNKKQSGCYYNRRDKMIYMKSTRNDNKTNRSESEMERVFVHEYMHHVHYETNQVVRTGPSSEEFSNLIVAIKKEVNNHPVIKGYTELTQSHSWFASERKVKTHIEAASPDDMAKIKGMDEGDAHFQFVEFMDIIGGATLGKYGGGHDKSYYNDTRGGHCEVFANMGTVYLKDNLYLKLLLPKSYEAGMKYFDNLFNKKK